MTKSDDFGELRAKHLSMVQDAVARMSNYSATMKRLCLIIVGGAVAVGALRSYWPITAMGSVMVILFWMLDARYLQTEKCFRELYDEIRDEPSDQRPNFRMKFPPEYKKKWTMMDAMVDSWSTRLFYFPLFIFLIAAAVIVSAGGQQNP